MPKSATRPLPFSPPTPLPHKTRLISHSLDKKLATIFRQERIKRNEMCIYVDSDEEQISNHPNLHANLPKSEGNQERLSLSSLEPDSWSKLAGPQEPDSLVLPSNKLSQKDLESPILTANHYQRVQEIDFQLYTGFLARSKIYGALLIDQMGRLLWCDKTAHQILEGSLNNFERVRVQNLLLFSKLDYFLQKMRAITQYDRDTTLKWILYSKNSKRRYFRVPLPSLPSNRDIFYRFLKCVTLRIRPISIRLATYRDPNGFVNQKLMSQDKEVNCFFLQLRHTKRPPDLENFDILCDPIIQKFMQSTKSKTLKAQSSTLLTLPVQQKSNKIRKTQNNEKKEEEDVTQTVKKRTKRRKLVAIQSHEAQYDKKNGPTACSLIS